MQCAKYCERALNILLFMKLFNKNALRPQYTEEKQIGRSKPITIQTHNFFFFNEML